jgi:hypothetical protein
MLRESSASIVVIDDELAFSTHELLHSRSFERDRLDVPFTRHDVLEKRIRLIAGGTYDTGTGHNYTIHATPA